MENFDLDIPTDRQEIRAWLLSSIIPLNDKENPDLDSEQIPSNVKETVESFTNFIVSVHQLEAIAEGNSSEEDIVKAFAKHPHSLNLLDELHKARSESWGNLIKIILEMMEGIYKPEKAVAIAQANSLIEIADLFLPNASELFNEKIQPIKSMLTQRMSENLITKLFELFKGILSCQFARLPQQANLLAEYLIQELISHQDSYAMKIRENVLKAQGAIEHSKKAGKRGGKKTQQGSQQTAKDAIALFLATNEYSNYTKAAEGLYPQIVELGKKHGFQFNSVINGHRTVVDWFRSTKRFQKRTS